MGKDYNALTTRVWSSEPREQWGGTQNSENKGMELKTPGRRCRNSESQEQRDGTLNFENKCIELKILQKRSRNPKNKGMEFERPTQGDGTRILGGRECNTDPQEKGIEFKTPKRQEEAGTLRTTRWNSEG